jgi:hypothetical protein
VYTYCTARLTDPFRCCDYFQLLYRSIEAKLRGELACRWEDATIEFIFSVPTTWNPHPTVERFRNIVIRAGFEKNTNHTVTIGLTEAEAAAVHTAKILPGLFKVILPLILTVKTDCTYRKVIYFWFATSAGGQRSAPTSFGFEPRRR